MERRHVYTSILRSLRSFVFDWSFSVEDFLSSFDIVQDQVKSGMFGVLM